MQIIVPIYIEFDTSIFPSGDFGTLPSTTPETTSITTEDAIYFIKLRTPTVKKVQTAIGEEANIVLKKINGKLVLRLKLYPSIGLGQGSSYKAELYKSICYKGILKNKYRPERSAKPLEELTLLDKWFWLIPNIYRLYDYSYQAYDAFINAQYTAKISKLTLQPNGTDNFDLSAHPDIIIIKSITDETLQSYNFNLVEGPSNTSPSFSLNLQLDTIPTLPINIDYYTPLRIEEIVYQESPRSYKSIAY